MWANSKDYALFSIFIVTNYSLLICQRNYNFGGM
jgi:hypothetical protein